MREARKKYNTDVSLHINMNDAYENSPDWAEYLEKDAIIKNPDGSLRKGGVWGGEQCYLISHTKEFKSGLAQKRILKLLEYLPELKDAKTIHIDAFFAAESPFDKITLEQDKESMFAISRSRIPTSSRRYSTPPPRASSGTTPRRTSGMSSRRPAAAVIPNRGATPSVTTSTPET